MVIGETAFLFMSFGSFALFGCALAWASWKESSHARRQEEERAARPASPPTQVPPLRAQQPAC